jgi:lipid II:glycine glycyltransferase (peptidoglycan interpeptide bridge formation enzyme)
LANEKELMQQLIDQLPSFDHFIQNWHYGYTNWLPFCWNGFQQTTRYTYVLKDLNETKTVWSRMEDNVRNHCKKASGRFKLQVRDDMPLDAFLKLQEQTFRRQGMTVPTSDEYIRKLDAACAERGCRKFFIAVDPEGQRHAGVYIVWDENSAYGLMAGADPALRSSGANCLCHWEAIKHASQVTQQFDFAGSMMEPVERFFRGFGATQVQYFNISKTPSRLLRIRQTFLSAVNGKYGGRRGNA